MAQLVIANEADISLNIYPGDDAVGLRSRTRRSSPTAGRSSRTAMSTGGRPGSGSTAAWRRSTIPQMRWAISYAIDRQQLVDFGYRGAGEPTTVPYPYYAGLLTYIEGISDLLEQYPTNAFDLAKTDELMTAAGLRQGRRRLLGQGRQRLTLRDLDLPGLCRDRADRLPSSSSRPDSTSRSGCRPTSSTASRPARGNVYIWGHGGSVRDPVRDARALPPEVRQAERRVHLPVLPLGERRIRRHRRRDGRHRAGRSRRRPSSSDPRWRSGCGSCRT